MWLKATETNRDVHILELDPGAATFFIVQVYPPLCGLPSRVLAYAQSIGDGFRVCTAGQLTAPGVWTHFAVTLDANTKSYAYYLNGAPSGVGGGDLTFPTSSLNQLRLGGWVNGSGYDYIGDVDEVAIFDRALRPDEILTVYRRGIGSGPFSISRHTDGRVTVTNTSATPRTLRLLVVK